MNTNNKNALNKPFIEELRSRGTSFREKVLDVTMHGVTLATTLLILKAVELLLHSLYGDQRFFDILPVAWVIQSSDLLILGKFVRESWKEFKQ